MLVVEVDVVKVGVVEVGFVEAGAVEVGVVEDRTVEGEPVLIVVKLFKLSEIETAVVVVWMVVDTSEKHWQADKYCMMSVQALA